MCFWWAVRCGFLHCVCAGCDTSSLLFARASIIPCAFVAFCSGFGESQLLQDQLRTVFAQPALRNAKRRDVVLCVPANGVLAIMKGAILFGLDPNRAILGRMSRYTYGISVCRRAQADDLPGKLFSHPRFSEMWCHDIFDVFVKRGQLVKVNEQISHVLEKHRPTDTQACMSILCSDSAPKYSDDPACQTLALLKLPMLESSQYLTVTFLFGGTEIKVTARDNDTGREVDATLSFQRLRM
jgi:hypothetical protein